MIGPNKTESPIEEMFYGAMREWMDAEGDKGIKCSCQIEIGDYRVDFLLTSSNDNLLVVECDGHEWHEKTKEQAKRDKSRDRWMLSELGLATVRYTGSEIYADAEGCASQALAIAHSIYAKIATEEWLESRAESQGAS